MKASRRKGHIVIKKWFVPKRQLEHQGQIPLLGAPQKDQATLWWDASLSLDAAGEELGTASA